MTGTMAMTTAPRPGRRRHRGSNGGGRDAGTLESGEMVDPAMRGRAEAVLARAEAVARWS